MQRIAVDAPHSVRPGDLARATGLANSTVDRITAPLIHLDYLCAAGRDLVPAPRLMELSNAYRPAGGLYRALRLSLERPARTLDGWQPDTYGAWWVREPELGSCFRQTPVRSSPS